MHAIKWPVTILLSLLVVACGHSPISRFEDLKTLEGRGHLFVARVEPKEGSMEVFVSDVEGANLDFTKIHMLATVSVDHRQWFMIPLKSSDHFSIDYPPGFKFKSISELRILLDDGRQNEIITFKRW